MDAAEYWAAVAAISSAVSTLAVLGTAFLALRQLRETTRVRQLEVLQNVFATLHTSEARADRQFVYRHEAVSYGKCSADDRDRIERLIVLYQNVAFLEHKGFIPTDLLLETYSGTFATVWRRLERYIKTKRAETALSNYAVNFETFAGKAIAFRKKEFGEQDVDYLLAREAP